jgi:hypothetical protein
VAGVDRVVGRGDTVVGKHNRVVRGVVGAGFLLGGTGLAVVQWVHRDEVSHGERGVPLAFLLGGLLGGVAAIHVWGLFWAWWNTVGH